MNIILKRKFNFTICVYTFGVQTSTDNRHLVDKTKNFYRYKLLCNNFAQLHIYIYRTWYFYLYLLSRHLLLLSLVIVALFVYWRVFCMFNTHGIWIEAEQQSGNVDILPARKVFNNFVNKCINILVVQQNMQFIKDIYLYVLFYIWYVN